LGFYHAIAVKVVASIISMSNMFENEICKLAGDYEWLKVSSGGKFISYDMAPWKALATGFPWFAICQKYCLPITIRMCNSQFGS